MRRDPRVHCVELAVSPNVLERSREARIARRRERLDQYFRAAPTLPVSMRHMAIYDLEFMAMGAIVAFQDPESLTQSLGVIEEVDGPGGMTKVRTPLEDLEAVASVRFGSARWDLNRKRESSNQ